MSIIPDCVFCFRTINKHTKQRLTQFSYTVLSAHEPQLFTPHKLKVAHVARSATVSTAGNGRMQIADQFDQNITSLQATCSVIVWNHNLVSRNVFRLLRTKSTKMFNGHDSQRKKSSVVLRQYIVATISFVNAIYSFTVKLFLVFHAHFPRCFEVTLNLWQLCIQIT